MSKYLRLDMYVNGREYLIAETPVSEDGFEDALNASDVVTGAMAADIRSCGGSKMSVEEYSTEEMLDILYEITGKDFAGRELDITFCMCEWDGEEHIRSMVALNSIN